MRFQKVTEKLILSCLALLLLMGTIAQARENQQGQPLTNQQWDAISKILQGAVHSGRIKGVSLLLMQRGQVLFKEAYGNLRADEAVRIASSSKPIAAAAILILVDEGKLSLDDSLAKYLPEFKGTKVETATLRQLLSHTAGIKARYPGGRPRSGTLADFSRLIASRGNLERPGAFSYSGVSIDVACRMAEAAAGVPMEEHIQKRLWNPLGMGHTSFWMAADPQTVPHEAFSRGEGRYISCGGGMTSTLDDVAAFYQMLLQGGVYQGKRILSAVAVTEMIRKHGVNPRKADNPYTTGEYGLALYRDRVSVDGAALTISHGGALGTMPWADLDRDLVGVFFTQERLNRVLPIAFEAQQKVRELIPGGQRVAAREMSGVPPESPVPPPAGGSAGSPQGRSAPARDPSVTFERMAGGGETVSAERFKSFFLHDVPVKRFQEHPEVLDRIFKRLDEDDNGLLTLEEYKGIEDIRSRRNQ